MNFLKLVTNSILRFIYNESEVYVGGYQSLCRFTGLTVTFYIVSIN